MAIPTAWRLVIIIAFPFVTKSGETPDRDQKIPPITINKTAKTVISAKSKAETLSKKSVILSEGLDPHATPKRSQTENWKLVFVKSSAHPTPASAARAENGTKKEAKESTNAPKRQKAGY